MTTDYDSKIDWDFIRGQEGDWSIGYVPNIKSHATGKIESGATILYGFDLGQHDLKELDSLKLSSTLKDKLSPYLKVRGAEAIMAAQRKFELSLDLLQAVNSAQTGTTSSTVGRMSPVGVSNAPGNLVKAGKKPAQFIAPPETALGLELSPDERAELSDAIQRYYYSILSRNYIGAPSKGKFNDLPIPVQTALLSLHWQTGAIWRPTHAGYAVFDAATRQDWADAVDSLTGSAIYWLPKYAQFQERRIKEAELIRNAMGLPKSLGPKSRKYLQQSVAAGIRTLGKLNP